MILWILLSFCWDGAGEILAGKDTSAHTFQKLPYWLILSTTLLPPDFCQPEDLVKRCSPLASYSPHHRGQVSRLFNKLINTSNFMHCGYRLNLYHPVIYGPSKKTLDQLKKSPCHAAMDRDLWPPKEPSLRGWLLFRWGGHCLTYRGNKIMPGRS